MGSEAPGCPAPILEDRLRRHARLVVLGTCLLAGFRVLLFGAAFPFFSNTDEQAHFDLVYKYAYEGIPRGIVAFSPEAAQLIVAYESPEYLHESSTSDPTPPPLWKLPAGADRSFGEQSLLSQRLQRLNHESTQPPVYYAVAAAWYRLGKAFGVTGGWELYWVRLLNVLVFVGVVWASFRWMRWVVPESSYLALGVPVLLAAFPQAVIYTINGDVLSPLLFGAAFFGLSRLDLLSAPSPSRALAIGLAAAGAFLTKVSNLAIIVLLAVSAAVLVRRSIRDGRRWIGVAATVALACGLPVALWMTRNLIVLGDLTGSADKARLLDWSLKPAAELLNHPIFSLNGIVTFCNTVMTSYWRGEVVWHGAIMAWRWSDAFFSLSSAVFVAAAAVRYLRRSSTEENAARTLGRASLLVLAVSFFFLFSLSVMFDFGRCLAPSREFPYLASGRLIWGTVAPFLFLYAAGLDEALSALGLRRYRTLALLLIATSALASEAAISAPVFRSEYNLFHLPW